MIEFSDGTIINHSFDYMDDPKCQGYTIKYKERKMQPNNLDSKGQPWPSMDKVPEQKEPDFEYFVIFDTKVGHYKMPFPAINEHDCIRQFMDLYRDPSEQKNNAYVLNPEHYQVFRIGRYYKKTGTFVPCQQEHIANLHEIAYAAQPRSSRPEVMETALGVKPSGH